MNELFQAICDAFNIGAQQSSLNLANGRKVIKACRAECAEIRPRLFTAEMLYERVVRNHAEVTRNDIAQICRWFSDEGSAIQVGVIRNGHALVPTYRYVGS